MASSYADLSRPPLEQDALRRALVGDFWTDLRVVPETGSTNADVAAAGRAGAPEGLVLIAESQTAGRGRFDRQWVAPPRSALTLSVLLRPPVPAARLGWLPLLTGVALAESVVRLAKLEAALKWPNDLLISERKAAGILAETVPDGVVVGIGLNVSQRADEVPAGATSLALAEADCVDRDPLLRSLLRSLAEWYLRWSAAGGDPEESGLAGAYTARCATVGREVSVARPGGNLLTGAAVAVDDDGRLVVATADGLVPLAAGDVQHVR
jgi:BirA family biotin operon repressor/biotin-[acetyl-CoA-carboxylase] ligase